MIMNGKIKRNTEEKRKDKWQGQLKMDNKIIQQVSDMKYLGVDINEYDKNTKYINSRRTATNHTMAKLINQGVNSTAIHPNLHGYLYKIFIRPTIMYGIENYQLNTYEEQAIARIEGNAIKRNQ